MEIEQTLISVPHILRSVVPVVPAMVLMISMLMLALVLMPVLVPLLVVPVPFHVDPTTAFTVVWAAVLIIDMNTGRGRQVTIDLDIHTWRPRQAGQTWRPW